MVDLALIFYSVIGAFAVALGLVLWVNRDVWLPIVGRMVSSISDEGRKRRAYRERIYDMSSVDDETVRTTSEPAEPEARTPDAHHHEPSEPSVREPGREPARLRQLSKTDLIVLLAVQRTPEGGYVYSANDITKFVGGTAADIKALIAAVRGESPVDQAARLSHLSRPANGW